MGEITVDVSTIGTAEIETDVKGVRGESVYDIAVRNGFTGTEADFIASLKGDRGDPGIQGPKGDTGHVDIAGKGLAITVDNEGIMHFTQTEE